MEKLKQGLFWFRTVTVTLSVLLTLIIGLAFTTGPYHLYHWLGTSLSEYRFRPDYIIVPGSSGYPSSPVMMRLWYAARLQKLYPESNIILSHPVDTAAESKIQEEAVRAELMMRGVDSSRIFMLTNGRNTREEALNIIGIYPELRLKNCVIVTSPEHVRRAILCFRREGVKHIGGLPAFEQPVGANLSIDKMGPNGQGQPFPVFGGSLMLRYEFWTQLKYELLCCRELAALAWYTLMDWI